MRGGPLLGVLPRGRHGQISYQVDDTGVHPATDELRLDARCQVCRHLADEVVRRGDHDALVLLELERISRARPQVTPQEALELDGPLGLVLGCQADSQQRRDAVEEPPHARRGRRVEPAPVHRLQHVSLTLVEGTEGGEGRHRARVVAEGRERHRQTGPDGLAHDDVAAEQRDRAQVGHAHHRGGIADEYLGAPRRAIGPVARAVEDHPHRGALHLVLRQARRHVGVMVLHRRHALGSRVECEPVGSEQRVLIAGEVLGTGVVEVLEVLGRRLVEGQVLVVLDVAHVLSDEDVVAHPQGDRRLELGAQTDDRLGQVAYWDGVWGAPATAAHEGQERLVG
jgi:hypothetical protein